MVVYVRCRSTDCAPDLRRVCVFFGGGQAGVVVSKVAGRFPEYVHLLPGHQLTL